MAGLNLRVGINALQATRELRTLSRNLAGVGTAASRSNKQIKSLQVGVTSLTATASALSSALLTVTGLLAVFGVGQGAAAALQFTANFSRGLAEVDTLLDKSDVSIQNYRRQLLELSTQSSKTLTDLSQGLYQAISAGIPAVEGAAGAFSVLEAAQRSAVAGLATTEVAVDATVSVLNAYGKEAISVSEINDKLFVAVREGKTRFDDLASGLGRVAPIAANTGVAFDDLLTAFVAITRSGVSPAETITGLRNLIRSIANPTQQTKRQIEELNKSLAENGKAIELSGTKLKEVGLTQTLIDLADATGGNSDVLLKLFPNIRALLPGLILLGKGFEDLTEVQDAFANSSLASAVAFDKIDKELTETFDKFISNLGKLSAEVLTDSLGTLNSALQEVNFILGQTETAVRIRTIFVQLADTVSVLADVFGAFVKGAAAFVAFKAIGAIASGASLAFGRLSLIFTQTQISAASAGASAASTDVILSKLLVTVGALSKTLTAMSASLANAATATMALARAQAAEQLALTKSTAAVARKAAAATAALAADRALALSSINVALANASAIPSTNGLALAFNRLALAAGRASVAAGSAASRFASFASRAAVPALILAAQADVLSDKVVQLRRAANEIREIEAILGRELGGMLDPDTMRALADSIDLITFPIIKLGQALNSLSVFSGFGVLFQDLQDVGGSTFGGNLGVTATDIGEEREAKKLRAKVAREEREEEQKRLKTLARDRKFATDKELKEFEAAVSSGARIDVSTLSENNLRQSTMEIAGFLGGFGKTVEDEIIRLEGKLASLAVFGELRTKSEEDLKKIKGATEEQVEAIVGVAKKIGAKTVGDIVLLAENEKKLSKFSEDLQADVQIVAAEINQLARAQDREFESRVKKGVAVARQFFVGLENSEKAAILTGGELAKRLENNIRLSTDLNNVESRAIAVRVALAALQEKILSSEQALAKARKDGNKEDENGLRIQVATLKAQEETLRLENLEMERRKLQAKIAEEEARRRKEQQKRKKENDRFQRALLSLERLREEALKSQRGSQLDLLNLEVRRIELEKELNSLTRDRAKAKREEIEAELRLSSALDLSVSKSGRLLDIRRNALTSERVSAVKETFAEEDALAREALSLELERIDAQLKAERRSIANASDDEDAVAKKRLRNVDKLIAVLGTARTSKVRPLIDKALRDAQEVLTVQGSQVSDVVENQIFSATNSYVAAQKSIRKNEEQFSKARAAAVVNELKSITEAIVADQKRRNASLIKGVKDLRQRARIEESIKVIASASDLDVESVITNLRAKIESEAVDFDIPLTFDLSKVGELSQELTSVASKASKEGFKAASDQANKLGKELLAISKIEPGDLDSGLAQEQFELLNSEIKDLADSLDPTMDKMAQRLLKLAKGTLVVTEETASFGESLLAAKRAELEAGAAADQLGGKLRGTVLNSIRQLRKELASLGFDIAKVFETALSGSFNIIEDFFDKSTSFFSKESSLLSSKIAARLNSPDLDIFGRIIGKTRSRLSQELSEIDKEIIDRTAARSQIEQVLSDIDLKAEATGADLSAIDTPDGREKAVALLSTREVDNYAGLIESLAKIDEKVASLRNSAEPLREKLSRGFFTGFNESAIEARRAIENLQYRIDLDTQTLASDQKKNIELLGERRGKVVDAQNAIIKQFGASSAREELTNFEESTFYFSEKRLAELSADLRVRLKELKDLEALEERSEFLVKEDRRKEDAIDTNKGRLQTLKEALPEAKTRFQALSELLKDAFKDSSKFAGDAFDDFSEATTGFFTKDGVIAFDNVGLESTLSKFGDIPRAFGKVADSFLVTVLRLPALLSFDADIAKSVGLSAVDALVNFGEFFLTALPEAFSLGVKIITEGLLYAFQQFISVLTKTLQPIGQAVAAPVSRLLGSLGSAVGVLADTPAEEDRRDRKEALELQRATLAQLQSNGASNETIAQEQARLAALLSTRPRETAAQRLESEIERAVAAAKNIAKDLGPLVKQFFTSVTAALPEVIPMLAMGLVEALNEFAAGFPEFFETLVTQVVDQLPLIIDALIDMLPFLVLALVNAATAIVRRLPDIVTGIINSLVENIPLIFEALADSLPELVGALIAAIPQITGALIAAIPQIIVALLRGVGTLVGEAIKGIPKFLGRLAAGLGALIFAPFEGFARAIRSFVNGVKAFIGATVGQVKKAGNFINETGSALIGKGRDDNTAARVTAGVLTFGVSELLRLHTGGNIMPGHRNPSLASSFREAGVQGFLNGGMVGDTLRKNFKASMSDDVPALLQTGEAVLNRAAVANVGGPSAIDAINSGAGMSPNLNVSVGINPNAQGLGSAAAALLPFLISSINVSSGDRATSMSLGERIMGYRAVRPLS